MQLIPVGQPRPAPNVCFICEQFHNEDARTVYVDTLRDFEAAVITSLTGKKIVCEHCIREFARVLGLPSEEDFNGVVEEAEALSEQVNALSEALDGSTKSSDVLDWLLENVKQPAPEFDKSAKAVKTDG